MALSYDETASLAQDLAFRGRIKVACLHFAKFILGEAVTVPAHNTRLRWAQRAIQSPDQVAQECQHNVVMEDQVQSAGSAVTDPDLQTATENAVNKML
jgi:hypothetical protein